MASYKWKRQNQAFPRDISADVVADEHFWARQSFWQAQNFQSQTISASWANFGVFDLKQLKLNLEITKNVFSIIQS